MRRLFPLLAVLSFSAAMAACGITDTNPPLAVDILHTQFASSLGVNPSTMKVDPYGVFSREDAVGTGDSATTGTTVYVEYIGWLPDGTQFDASPQGTPLAFIIGDQSVIPGFQIGVLGMQAGGTRTIIVPSPLAYGNSTLKTGSTTIPPNSNLVFRITLDSLK